MLQLALLDKLSRIFDYPLGALSAAVVLVLIEVHDKTALVAGIAELAFPELVALVNDIYDTEKARNLRAGKISVMFAKAVLCVKAVR